VDRHSSGLSGPYVIVHIDVVERDIVLVLNKMTNNNIKERTNIIKQTRTQ
jgi:hypothetical protein